MTRTINGIADLVFGTRLSDGLCSTGAGAGWHRAGRRWRALAATVLALSGVRVLGGGIQHVSGGFLFSGAHYNLVVSDTNGCIVSVAANGGAVALGGEAGLWSATFKEGGSLNAAAFQIGSPSNTFQWARPPDDSTLLLTYSNADIATTVTLTARDDGVELSARVQPRRKTVLEFSLPARLRFTPAGVQGLIAPNASSDGVGAEYNAAFFQPQTESHPAGWTTATAGPSGYHSLYGGYLVSRPSNDPAVPVTFTADGLAWLGTSLSNKWSGASALVNRAPATGQTDLVLLTSTNGAFFSGSHLGGAGWLLRLGGQVDTARAPLAQDIAVAAVEHLAQSPGSRTKVALLALERGPASGSWAAVTVSNWRSRLNSSAALASAGIQVVELSNAQAMLDALSTTNYLAMLNPYGESTPARLSGGMTQTVAAVGSYVRAGGNWFEVGGYPFYYALQSQPYYSCSIGYPPAFADFLQLETDGGTASLFGVQPAPAAPWDGATNPAALFVPGRLAWGADVTGGYLERAFGAYVASNQTWQSPAVRLTVGLPVAAAIQAYCLANGISRALADKMSPETLASFKQSVLIKLDGTCAQLSAHLSQLPSPALVHVDQYLHGGFDKQYPDHLPPIASFGTPTEFSNLLAQCCQQGLLLMPYTNPTWWCDHPRGPTFVAAGTAPLLVNSDGTFSYEAYGTNDGYTVCQWHPAVRAANRSTVSQFTSAYPVNLLFEDQIGARSWKYDYNAASPAPCAYAAGLAAQAAEDCTSLPLATENGWDRVVNDESQFCGMTWGLVPTTNAPDWRTFLRDRYAPGTWRIFPLVQQIAHDKLALAHHNLGQSVTSDEVLSWTLGLGYGMGIRMSATDLDTSASLQWLLWLDRVQKSVCSRYTGEPLAAFSHAWADVASSADSGTIGAGYGPVSLVANLGPQPRSASGYRLSPFGFVATAPGMIAANVLSGDAAEQPVSYVAEAGDSRVDFWIYSAGERAVSVALPSGVGRVTGAQLAGEAVQGLAQGSSLEIRLGMKPGQERLQPPAALAGLAPSQWPGGKPAIGILNVSGMPRSWTTITPTDWLQAFSQSNLALQYGVPVRQITNVSDLVTALQAGPTNYLAIVNPGGENFLAVGSGQGLAMIGLIRDYVNRGGSWWETAGYSFYKAAWQSGGWKTETLGAAGMNSLGLPVGGGDTTQAAEAMTVTTDGHAVFGPALSARLAGLSAAVNRGLTRSDPDPGHLALLAGATQDFLGCYRLEGWGYLWRYGGFNPNPSVALASAPAVMEYLYTHVPLPAVASSAKYLWHGSAVPVPAQRGTVLQVVSSRAHAVGGR